MRRGLYGLLALFLVFPLSIASTVAAQDATPEAASPFASLDLPTLDITSSMDGLDGIPEQLEAGRYLIRFTADEGLEFGAGMELIQPPAGMTAEEFMGMMMGPPEGGATPEAMPAESDMAASPEAGMGGPPSAMFEATWAGGATVESGQTSEVVLDLTPGEWLATDYYSEAPIVFEATGEMPADLPEPDSAATVTMGEYFIEVSEGELTTGSYVVRVDNEGAQPHFLIWAQAPDGTTEEQLQTVLQEEMEAEMTGTPPAYSDFNPEEDTTDVIITGNQSTGTSQWVVVNNVEAGTHILICFFPDAGDGIPHAYHGMYTIVEIAE